VKKYQRTEKFLKDDTCRHTDHNPVQWKGDKRPRCKVCLARTSYSCSECLVGLCLASGQDGGPSCWEKLHA
jgi:hypothetical protein